MSTSAKFVVIVGPSGCGKSTLLNIIAGLTEPDTGHVILQGDANAERIGKVAYMHQIDLLLPWRNVLSNATLGLEIAGIPRAEAESKATELAQRFGIADFLSAYPATLSGGMRQRVALLRAVLPDRDVLLLDEPFKALDAITRSELQRWLSDVLDRSHRATIMVTHDVEEALMLGDRVLVMSPRPGRILLELDVELPRPRPRDVVREPTSLISNGSCYLPRQLRNFMTIDTPMSSQQHISNLTNPPEAQYPTVSEHTFAMRARSFIRAWGSAMALAALGLVLWEILVRVLNVQTWILPPRIAHSSPNSSINHLFSLRHATVTAQEILIGFAVSITFACAMATAMFWSKLLERSVYPFLIASQTIPVFTLAPMLLIWIGTGIAPKIVVVVLFTFFPVTINLMTGLKSVDSDMVDMFRTLGASRWQMFTKLYVRSALPYLFAGLKVAAVVSVIGAVIGEWVSAASGLGWLIKDFNP